MLLKVLRNQKHLTQAEIARKLKISVRQYQRIEHGDSFPKKDAMDALEDLFGVPHRVYLAKSMEDVPDFLKCFLSQLYHK
ncbi:helix-turn-helix domain-containing protein [Pontibacillus litoralis]|uniref:HTH cro/C1-type domain-containing protein n=1 Tax=Pontibacillus litoralis JSM 072002 TaxID=1385512 RepID=A0A0A5G288_9BACI|nr:helix-turn-helix transcriptional regulator [Pontibacillus litoralis]KGX85195.1 hypothetical protein N784_09875 [Pontibacillus litoralis JSM 072002]